VCDLECGNRCGNIRAMRRLSATAVKAATRPGRLSDGDGLYLIIKPGGAKSWVCRVQRHGNRRDFGLGSAKKVSLAVARERAREVRAWIELGLDPVFERRKILGFPTFREAANKVLAASRKSWLGLERVSRNLGASSTQFILSALASSRQVFSASPSAD